MARQLEQSWELKRSENEDSKTEEDEQGCQFLAPLLGNFQQLSHTTSKKKGAVSQDICVCYYPH